MSNQRIDILEEEILKLAPEVLERLLWDHSRPKYKNELGEECHHHIYWATDMYESRGDGFGFFDEIMISSVTGENRMLVRPRAVKSKEEQEKRTREKAEVFTPAWVCNAQNNLIDEAWFGRKGVFNHENDDHTWTPNREDITFPEGKTWKDYVWDKRLEITCGEAPYLVSRYDAITGEPIDDLMMRVGLLDRKLRVVNQCAKDKSEWMIWAECALKSIYGYEWQGDNLLLAREAIFYTFIDYYEDFCTRKEILPIPSLSQSYARLAYLISWNIFQMDGIKMTLPMSGELEKEAITTTLFPEMGVKVRDVKSPIQAQTIYAKVADWPKRGMEQKKVYYFKDIK